MTALPDEQPGFASEDDAPIPYMARTREYYQAIGYTTPYRWAHYVDAPFQPLQKPLAQSRIAIITTAAPFDPAKGDQGPGAKYNGGAKFYSVYDGDTSKSHDLRISHIAYDRVHTSADDSGTWFPLPQMLRLAREGRIGEVAPRFFGAPTNRSHRVTIDTDAPEILARCRGRSSGCRGAGAELPGLPPDRQPGGAASGGQRHLHRGDGLRQGHRRACRGAAVSVQRFPARQFRRQAARSASQAFTLELALRVLETAPGPQTTVQSPLRWSADAAWKRDYNNVALLSAEELARRRREFDAQKEIARGLRETRLRRQKPDEIRKLRTHDRFTLTLHFARRGLSRAAKPRKVLPHYREIIRCRIDARPTRQGDLWRRRRDRRTRRDPGLRRPQYLRTRRQHRVQQCRQAAKGADVADHRPKRPFFPRQSHLVARQFRRRCIQSETSSGLPVSDIEERLRKSEAKKRALQRRIRELLGEG